MSTDDGSYRVDLEHLDAVTSKVAGLHGFVHDSLTGLDQRITTAHQQWTGATADKHATAHREWMTAAGEVRDGIEALRAAAKTAHESYSDTVTANHRVLGA
ncbi:WXG100 family type VII secretion target [Nocardia sp. NEAU-G5]|uniref:ESAT-6-like protein n=1 Tax=Nocardia albiluteola TaxID=2842303 RepID=A0ABS6B776_9NOCA|nr:WXG100 family type VII secretion target [Nocardia albiluteola]MBU3066152.1 WXG100 family type VII secretion target [Nocardia albiluteola]